MAPTLSVEIPRFFKSLFAFYDQFQNVNIALQHRFFKFPFPRIPFGIFPSLTLMSYW